MKRGSISVVVPTVGRPSLARTLGSIAPQLSPGDEVMVVADGPRPWVPDVVAAFGDSFRCLATDRPARDYGSTPRNLGVERAGGDYLAFMDDDDVYLPGAFEAMRKAVGEHYERLFVFRMKHSGSILWNDPELRLNNVSTQMFCFPNRRGRLGRWRMNPFTSSGRGDDFLFAKDTADFWPPGSVLFMNDIIAELKEHSYADGEPV